MSTVPDDIFLIWEDEEPGGRQWWLARAHDVAGEEKEFFIAEDDLAGYLVGVVRCPPAARYRVIAAVPLPDPAARSIVIADIKTAAANWLASGLRGNLWRWRLTRWSKLAWSHFPTALAGFSVGGALGLLVAFFAVSSGLVGWPMLAAGLVIGAGSGPALKFLVDRRPKNAVAGPWTHFAIIALGAVMGAVLTAGGVFALFWGG